jgi:hypothetical protein
MYLLPFVVCAQNINGKKLIELGWDCPRISYLAGNIREMEKRPFDGVVFAFDSSVYNAFDTERVADSYFQFAELSKIKWKKFTDNFLLIRSAGSTGAHWLDDNSWQAIMLNLKKISKVIALTKAKGIMFDPEYYFNNPDNDPWKYKPALYEGQSYEQVGEKVKLRGMQFIRALQTYKPDLKVLSTWLLSISVFHIKNSQLKESQAALLPFFVEGMMEAKNTTAEIIDGNELSYYYNSPISFIDAGDKLKDDVKKLVEVPLQFKFSSIGMAQSVYYDGLYTPAPPFDKGLDKNMKDRWFAGNLYCAYKTTDKYVWLYNEKLEWWKNNQKIEISGIIDSVKKEIVVEENIGNLKSGNSKLYSSMKNPPLKGSFSYIYSKGNNTIKITANAISKKLSLYCNSRLIETTLNPPMESVLRLKKIYKGNLIITVESQNGTISVAFIN